jgi:hypothetical protein
MNLALTLDTETFPNCFLFVARFIDSTLTVAYEISQFRDDSRELLTFLQWMRDSKVRAYGFNIVGFDGPIIHLFMRRGGKITPLEIYEKAQAIISSQDEDKFAHTVKPTDRDFEWVDLYRINHFHNRARSTSLKALEFNMRMENIEDLPFAVGTMLNQEQIEVLKDYCVHDVVATELFRTKNTKAIEFREQLGAKYGRDFLNHDDVKIGSTIFEIMLENAGVVLYEYGKFGRKIRQTKRPVMALTDAILPWITFERPEFQRVLNWLRQQTITETKGVFKDVTATVDGLTYVFGLGGIHGAVENRVLTTTEDVVIESVDVSSYYPNLSISNRFYPEHLGEKFCDVYKQIYDLRKTFAKGTTENAAYKLAANGTYGKTNDVFSPFYDPLLTMKITLNGQLLLCMLVERLIQVPTVQVKMINTDGLEYMVQRDHADAAVKVCEWWQTMTKLTLERTRYKELFISDVNNYLGVFEDGSVKRKGRYEYDLEWHQNASALVVAKVAEKVLVEGVSVMDTLLNWSDRMDFMLRVKVPRTSHLLWGDERVQNTCRYYVSTGGQALTKVMPPLPKKPDHWRRIGVESGWTVCVCNDIADAVLPINYAYYVEEIEKLTLRMK